MQKTADWYFDYISPYPYLQIARFDELPSDLMITPKPVLFAALLNHWGHKGPAEIPAKARQTFYYTRWIAEQRGLPFAGPPRHPFNPLALLRLTNSLGSKMEIIKKIYAHIWGDGNDGQSLDSLATLEKKLGIDDLNDRINDPVNKQAIKDNTEKAIQNGVYGVPTFQSAGHLFWGDDVTPMFVDFLNNPKLFTRPGYAKVESISPAAHRQKKLSGH